MSMLLRRRLMEASSVTPAPGGLGEFSKGYAATLTPNSQTELVIQHNMGVTPKVVILEMVDRTAATLTNYAYFGIYELDISGMQNDKTGLVSYAHRYNGTDYTDKKSLPDTDCIEADTTTVTLKPPYNNNRSPFDTGTTYRVQVYG